MVSGFLTSPWLHARISSAVARPIRSWSKKFTSSTVASSPSLVLEIQVRWTEGRGYAGRPAYPRRGSDFFDRAGLAPGQVDAELLGGAEHVLLRVTELDARAVLREHLDVEAQRLHLLDEDLERLRDARVGDVLALDDRLVHLHAARHVVGLDGEQLLEGVGGAVRLHRPDLHLAEPLATELGLTTQRLLRDHRVGAGRAGVDLVVDQVEQLQDVDVADRD